MNFFFKVGLTESNLNRYYYIKCVCRSGTVRVIYVSNPSRSPTILLYQLEREGDGIPQGNKESWFFNQSHGSVNVRAADV